MSTRNLVIIDPQKIFAAKESPWCSPFFTQAFHNISRLVPHFPDTTTITRWLPTAERAGTSWEAYFHAWPFADVGPEDWLYELVPEAQALGLDETVDEPTFGKWGTQLQKHTGDAPHLILTGVSTDCCVISTALAAVDAGATVTVVTDAVAHSTTEAGQATLDVMALYEPQILLRSTDEIIVEMTV